MATGRTFEFSEYMHINVGNKNMLNNYLFVTSFRVKGQMNEPLEFFVQPKGLFTLNAILVRFAVVRSFMRFLTQAVDENIFYTIQTQTVLLPTGCFAKLLTIVF